MQLYLIRHGESGNNALSVEKVGYDAYMARRNPDPPLTEAGRQQSALVATHLVGSEQPEIGSPLTARSTYGITRLYCSAMLRALQTAAPIGAALGLQPEVWVDIHEHGGLFHGNPRNGGLKAFPGLSRSSMAEQFPGYVLPDAVTEEGWWTSGYEEIDQCQARARRVADTLRARAATEPDAVLGLVTHGTFVDRLLKALLQPGETSDAIFYFHYNTAITLVDFQENGRLVLRFSNRTEHLPDELITL